MADPVKGEERTPEQNTERLATLEADLAKSKETELAATVREGRLNSELGRMRTEQRVRAELEASRGEKAPDAHEAVFKQSLDDLDSPMLRKAVQAEAARIADEKIDEAFRREGPRIAAAARGTDNADKGFRELEDDFGVENPKDLQLDKSFDTMNPAGAYVGSLVAAGKLKEAQEVLGRGIDKREKVDANQRIVDLMRRSEAGDHDAQVILRKTLGANSGGEVAPGTRGYGEGEAPSLMHELSLAPHARTKDPNTGEPIRDDQWVGEAEGR